MTLLFIERQITLNSVLCCFHLHNSLILLPIVHVRGFKAASNDLSSWKLQLQCLQNSWFWGRYNYSDMDFSLCWWWWCKLVLVTEQRVFLWTTKRRFRFKSCLGCLSRKLLTFWWCMIKRKEGDDATLPNTESIHTFMYIRWSLLLVLCQLSQVKSSRLVKRFLCKPFLILINKSIFFELRKRDKQVKCLDLGAALWAQA